MITYSSSGFLPDQIRSLHKFGGSSLQNAEGYLHAIEILRTEAPKGAFVVLSASGNTTNQLIEWYRSRSPQKGEAILSMQSALLEHLFTGHTFLLLKECLIRDFENLNRQLLAPYRDEMYADFLGQGELWSARILSALLTKAQVNSKFLDARLFLKTEAAVLPTIDIETSRALLYQCLKDTQWAADQANYVVIPGFIASNAFGKTILLGRNGSDYSATQVAALINAKSITLWGDTIGVYSADPYRVKGAVHLPKLSFELASELARLGNHLFHSRTLDPIRKHPIPLFIRSSLFPKIGGTQILPLTEEQKADICETRHIPILTTSAEVKKIVLNKPIEPPGSNIARLLSYLKSIEALPLAYTETRHEVVLIYPAEYASNMLNQINTHNLHASLCKEANSLLGIIEIKKEKADFRAEALRQLSDLRPVEFIPVGFQHMKLMLLLNGVPHQQTLTTLHEHVKQLHGTATSPASENAQYLSFANHRIERFALY